jgi:hypothetical protein
MAMSVEEHEHREPPSVQQPATRVPSRPDRFALARFVLLWAIVGLIAVAVVLVLVRIV